MIKAMVTYTGKDGMLRTKGFTDVEEAKAFAARLEKRSQKYVLAII